MKDWTGGDRITCRALYGEQFDFKPQFKLVFCCNHLPTLPPDDEGTWRRISVVEFSSKFKDTPDLTNPLEFIKDPYLTDKLYSWKECFMYILLENYKTYKKDGLKEPEEVKRTTQEYRRINDIYCDFISDNIVHEPGGIDISELYIRFKEWWGLNYNTKIPSQKERKSSLEKKMGKYTSVKKKGLPEYSLVEYEHEI